MILSRLGKPIDEEALCAGWPGSKRGYPLESAAKAIGGNLFALDPDMAMNYAFLSVHLARMRWIIAQVFSREMGRFTDAWIPQVTSRFGSLAQVPLGSLHAVVLIDTDESGFIYLDPYYPAGAQPFKMTRTQFATVWQGMIVVSPELAAADLR